MNYLNQTTCITILAIIVFIIFYYNQNEIREGLDGPASSPSTNEGNAYIENKENTGTMTESTTNAILADVQSKITECREIINDVNRILPRRIEDITVGTINQTDNLDLVGISIVQGVTTTLDPITDASGTSGTWTINATLPRGKKGPMGDKGLKGGRGQQGAMGMPGKPGPQGLWGKDCSNNNCN